MAEGSMDPRQGISLAAAPLVAEKIPDSPRGRVRATPLWKHPIVVALLLVVVTAGVYAPMHHHPFSAYDDGAYVTDNDHVKNGLHRGNLRWAFKWAMTSNETGNWLPVTWYSHMLDYRLFQDHAGLHHDVNLLLHLVNVALLFWVLLQATGRAGPSLMVAALFALHPINTESVAWIAERKNLLSMMFFLLALGAWGWYARKPRWYRYLAVAFLFALGLMSKAQVVTLPFILLLWDYWPLERVFAGKPASVDDVHRPPARSFGWLLLEKIPLLALSAGCAVVTVWAQRTGGGYNPEPALSLRLENAAVSYVRYIGKAFWPSHLALLYPVPRTSLPAWQTGLALLLLIAITAWVVWARQRRYLLVGWLWFLGTLVPMIGLVQVGWQAMADRYAYLSFIGLFIMLCWGVADEAQQWRFPRAYLVACSCAVLLVLAGFTHRQIGYWRDDIALWTHTTQITHENYIGEDNLAEDLQKAGRLDEAQTHILRAAEIYPTFPRTLIFLALHNQRDGKLREAIAQYQQVIAQSQRSYYQSHTLMGMAYANMGRAYRDLGEMAEARDSLQAGLALKSDNFEAWMDLGLVSQQMGDLNSAIHDYYRAITIHPFDVGYLILAQALKQSGHQIEAKRAEQKAKDLTGDYERAQQIAAKAVATGKAPE
ncbi:MAG: tetratricopeptide repeat protein [Candidatus Korobacteraceae bacterium]|jgi:protein O-mannosyl-transferase